MASGSAKRRGRRSSAVKATTKAQKRREKQLDKAQRARLDRGEDLPF